MPLTNSRKNINNLDKFNTYGNITTNNSDKENTDFTTKKNNLTTHCNNIPYFTTNFNNSKNIIEANNNEITSESEIIKQKKNVKKKLCLTFHPNSKKGELYKQIEIKNKSLIKHNIKNEMNIPYNKKSIKNCKIVKDIIPLNI